jgi:hypothetical protein
MRTAPAVAAAITLAMLLPRPARGSVAGLAFRELVKKAEIIVEGEVVSQIDLPKPAAGNSTFYYTKESLVKVTRVHKGGPTVGKTIRVRSDSTFICDTCRLARGRKYVLVLKGTGQGYVDVNYGQGTSWIVPLGDRRIVAVGGSVTTGGYPLETFRGRLAWALAEPPERPGKPTLSKEQALAIARKALTRSGVKLGDFKLRKVELLRIGSELVGVAHKGDWMWMCDWQKPEAAGKSPRPPGTFTGCYVHARTGAVSSWLQRGLSTEDVCRIFLKTYHPFRRQFADLAEKARFREVTESRLRESAARAGRTFFRLRDKYEPATRFLVADFPADGDGRSLLFVLAGGRRISYAGVLPPRPAGKKSEAA